MSGILDLFIPKEKKFFEFLNQQVIILDDCVDTLASTSSKKLYTQRNVEKALRSIQKKSDSCREIGKEVVIALHQTFITPIDREEIQSLSVSITRCLNIVEKIAITVRYCKISKLDPAFIDQLEILTKQTKHLHTIFKEPLFVKKNEKHIDMIKYLEEVADEMFGKATGRLFNNGHSAIEIIKQKELLDLAEEAIDRVRSIVDILDIVLINNA